MSSGNTAHLRGNGADSQASQCGSSGERSRGLPKGDVSPTTLVDAPDLVKGGRRTFITGEDVDAYLGAKR